ncbi:hypothetical protein BDR03DRAFT_987889 [Suillus americanus]|nr:hypothetical protein BDR03DRAFT_987889 [Suillus americanus]
MVPKVWPDWHSIGYYNPRILRHAWYPKALAWKALGDPTFDLPTAAPPSTSPIPVNLPSPAIPASNVTSPSTNPIPDEGEECDVQRGDEAPEECSDVQRIKKNAVDLLLSPDTVCASGSAEYLKQVPRTRKQISSAKWRLESLQLRGTWLLTVLITRRKNMAPFNLALLTMTPSPEPEECPSLLVKATTPPKEVEESFEARALHVWAGLRKRLDTLIKLMPDDDPALFVNRESWMRNWNELHESLSELGVKSANEGITLELDDEGLAQLAEGKHAYCACSREICSMKSKAITELAPSTPPHARCSQVKMVPEVTAPAKKDAEEKLVMRPGAHIDLSLYTEFRDKGKGKAVFPDPEPEAEGSKKRKSPLISGLSSQPLKSAMKSHKRQRSGRRVKSKRIVESEDDEDSVIQPLSHGVLEVVLPWLSTIVARMPNSPRSPRAPMKKPFGPARVIASSHPAVMEPSQPTPEPPVQAPPVMPVVDILIPGPLALRNSVGQEDQGSVYVVHSLHDKEDQVHPRKYGIPTSLCLCSLYHPEDEVDDTI